jgi:riboflavin transporter FmnP
MAHPPRTTPLRADEAVAGPESPPVPRSRLRSVLLGVGVGTGVGVAAMAIAFSIVAIPMFILASTEPDSGLDRSLVRTGLFKVALPLGLVAGIVAGVVVGLWYARGGRLPTDRTPIHG